jgi:hypothetical protein
MSHMTSPSCFDFSQIILQPKKTYVGFSSEIVPAPRVAWPYNPPGGVPAATPHLLFTHPFPNAPPSWAYVCERDHGWSVSNSNNYSSDFIMHAYPTAFAPTLLLGTLQATRKLAFCSETPLRANPSSKVWIAPPGGAQTAAHGYGPYGILAVCCHNLWPPGWRNCSRSRRRAAKVDKRMYLDYTHGLFIT